MYIRKDLAGEKFGRWEVLKYGHKNERNEVYWICKCQCGKVKEVRANSLRSGRSKSCGCLHAELSREIGLKVNKKHGQAGTPLYAVWNGMKQRCGNPNSTSYADYGGRGINVCEEWNNFDSFYEWATSNGYRQGLSIDRIDNSGNYEPSNCRWVSGKTQCRNRRNNTRFKYGGRSLTLAEWETETGIKRSTLASRLYTYGWTVEKALTTK